LRNTILNEWIQNLKRTIQPIRTILNSKIGNEPITEDKFDNQTNTLVFREWMPQTCSRFLTETDSDKLKRILDKMIENEHPEDKTTAAGASTTTSSSATSKTDQSIEKLQKSLINVEDRLKGYQDHRLDSG